MRRVLLATAIVTVLHVAAGCQSGKDTALDSADLEARVARLNASLANVDSTASPDEPIARWLLPPELAEISGLALTSDGRLFAHDDETAQITEIDYRRGTIIKYFLVGKEDLRADFEGLTCVGERFFLLASNGILYEFLEGADREQVDFTMHDTGLGKECEFEGVAYDSTTHAIILACKNLARTQPQGMLVMYRYPLDSAGGGTSQFTVPVADAVGTNDWKQVRPTDITVDPSNGNYVLVAAQENALVAFTPTGEVVVSQPLGDRHPQPEGIAITRDHILIISDESNKSAASITLYRWP